MKHHVLCALAALAGAFSIAFAGSAPAPAAAEAPPRLWKAVRDAGTDHPTTIYVLAATHLGLPAEYGPYFDSVVLPAFDAADDLRFEGAGNGRPEPYPHCDHAPLDAEGQARLERFRKLVEQRRIEAWDVRRAAMARAGTPDPQTKAQRDDESRALARSPDEFFLLMEYHMDNATVLSAAAAAAPRASAGASGPRLQVDVAHALRARRPGLPVLDVDSAFGVARAYCRAGVHRTLFLDSFAREGWSESPEVLAGIPKMQDAFIGLLREGRPVSDALTLAPELDDALVCDRTQEWLRDLGTLRDGRTHFLVLGAQHLFDLHRDGHPCAGLLQGLAEAGMTPNLAH